MGGGGGNQTENNETVKSLLFLFLCLLPLRNSTLLHNGFFESLAKCLPTDTVEHEVHRIVHDYADLSQGIKDEGVLGERQGNEGQTDRQDQTDEKRQSQGHQHDSVLSSHVFFSLLSRNVAVVLSWWGVVNVSLFLVINKMNHFRQ